METKLATVSKTRSRVHVRMVPLELTQSLSGVPLHATTGFSAKTVKSGICYLIIVTPPVCLTNGEGDGL